MMTTSRQEWLARSLGSNKSDMPGSRLAARLTITLQGAAWCRIKEMIPGSSTKRVDLNRISSRNGKNYKLFSRERCLIGVQQGA
jgi:hypothetical protein